MFPEPSAPPLFDLLKDEESHVDFNYNCEEGCDVEFLVGKCEEDLIRIPVHSCKLSDFPYFKAMLSEDYDAKYNICDGGKRKLRQIRVHWIDRKAFDNMMKFIYKQPVNLQAVEMTVETLKAAHEFLLPGLVRACVKHLSKLISLSNVLFIFANVRYLCNDMDNLEELVQSDIYKPLPKRRKHSLPYASQTYNHAVADQKTTLLQHQDNQHLSAGLEMKNLCVWLLCQCLGFIDVHAVDVLESDEMEELDRSFIKFLLQRDSLFVSELAVFSALIRWAETECKRQHLPLTCESKRLVLHDLIYVVRFFQMPVVEFLSGPNESGLLSSGEVELIKGVLLHNGRLQQFQKVTSPTGYSPSNLSAFNKQQILNAAEVEALRKHWKYLSQPRTPRLNNGVIGNGSGNYDNRSDAKKRRKCSLEETSKKGLQKFKRVGLLIRSFCIPCAYQKHRGGKSGEFQRVVLINNNFINGQTIMSASSQNQNSNNSKTANTCSRPCTLQRSESKLSKAFDYSLRAFAFFFD